MRANSDFYHMHTYPAYGTRVLTIKGNASEGLTQEVKMYPNRQRTGKQYKASTLTR